jgi:hypothetical protein
MLRGIYLKSLAYSLELPIIREDITKFSVKYRDKITHPNALASTLLEEEEEEPRRLKRSKLIDLHNQIS